MEIAGIDEAGRGPVIGPMVIAIAMIDENKVDELKKLGVKDSKLLTPNQRETMFSTIKNICKHEIVSVSPKEIDYAVESEKTNLNWLEADTQAVLLNRHRPKKAYIDCPSANAKAYTQYLRGKLEYEPELIVEHKADYKYLIVGAASILAKVTRDREIEALKKKHGVDFGSGYPADPITAEFIKKNYDQYNFFRRSWGTWKTAAKKDFEKQKNLSGF
jgi:ribonuclease HII